MAVTREADMIARNPILTVAHVWKTYTAAALADAHFDLDAGEVHAVVGENGAGKSTLARIIAGVTPPDRGELRLAGQRFAPKNRLEAERSGVRLVMQELNLIANLSVAENIFFDRLPHRFGWIDYRRLDREAREAMARVGLPELDPTQLTGPLGIGQQQLIEIAANLSRQCRVLILDEPTAALTSPEIERLCAQIARLKATGVGIVYISHRLEEVQRLADRITVLRDGKVIGTYAAGTTDPDKLIRLMVGRELAETTPRFVSRHRPVALRAVGLCRGAQVRDVNFEARYGGILGFAGLMGSGRTETMRTIFGADRLDAGQIFLDDSAEPAAIDGPHDAVRHGIALLTEDRKAQGLLLPLPVRANLTLTNLRPLSRLGGWICASAERHTTELWIRKLSVRCASIEQPIDELSGGNQQKIVIAKWLCRDCRILIFDEPTRGIDVSAKFDVYQLLRALAEHGKAILIVSSDLKELTGLCDRIAVMSAGRIEGVFDRGDWTPDKIMAAAFSNYRVVRSDAPAPDS
jgi:ribose transport system ATP-binding protein